MKIETWIRIGNQNINGRRLNFKWPEAAGARLVSKIHPIGPFIWAVVLRLAELVVAFRRSLLTGTRNQRAD